MTWLLHAQKSFDFFGFFYFNVIFKSYPQLLKCPEFMALGVSKHASSTPVLKPPNWLLNRSFHNFSQTTSSYQIHILCPSLIPKFSVLALHCSHLKSSIYSCCKFSIFIKIMMFLVSAILTTTRFWATEYSMWKTSTMSNSSWLHHIHLLSAFVMINIKKADISIIYTKSFFVW